jgi:hypothetical protein
LWPKRSAKKAHFFAKFRQLCAGAANEHNEQPSKVFLGQLGRKERGMKSGLKVLLLALGIAATAVIMVSVPASAQRRYYHPHCGCNGSLQATSSWSVPRNGAGQPVDRHGIPLPGYSLGPS